MSDNIQPDPDNDDLDSPQKDGATLSASTGSFKMFDQHDPNISRLATTFFEKTSKYLLSELNSTKDDYKLLENMNNLTAEKYADMKQIANNVSRRMNDINEKYTELQPLLKSISDLKDNATKLEEAAYKIDAYSKRLEDKFKSLEKRYIVSKPT